MITKSGMMTIAAALALVPLALLSGGCSQGLSDSYAQDQLNQAHQAYQAAKADPHVEAVAPDMLLEANLALQEADKSGNADDVTSLAYVAQRKVQTARAMTEGKLAETEFQQMSKVNTALLMQKREREARMAREEAVAKGKEAETARMQARMSATQAEQARMEADRRSAEIAQAKKDADMRAAETERLRSESQQARMQSDQSLKETQQARQASEQARAEAQQARAEQAEMMRELSDLRAKETEKGLVLTLGDVLFETGKSDISPRAKSSIDKLANFLNNHPDRTLMVEGYTDNVGSETFNRQLSEKRAESVRKALLARGVDEDRVDIKGNGMENPVASNSTRHGRQLNRRVEVIILNQGAAGGPVSR